MTALWNKFKRFDHSLLIAHPRIWSSRLHKLVPLGTIAIVLLICIALFVPVSLTSPPPIEAQFIVLLGSSMTLSLGWLLRLAIDFRSWPLSNTPHFLVRLLILGITLVIINIPPWIFAAVLHCRIQNLVTRE